MDINSLANMKLSEFENIGKVQYDKGFYTAIETVVRLLGGQICEDFQADGACEQEKCSVLSDLSEGLESVMRGLTH